MMINNARKKEDCLLFKNVRETGKEERKHEEKYI